MQFDTRAERETERERERNMLIIECNERITLSTSHSK